jgi:MFS family permease
VLVSILDESQKSIEDLTQTESSNKGILSRIRGEFDFIKGNLLLLYLGSFIIDFTGEMAFTYYSLYVKALGGTVATVGLISSVQQIVSAFTGFPGGYIADKHGRKQILWTMTLFMGFATLFYVFAPNWETILIGAALKGVASIYTPAFNALVMDSIPPEKRGTGFSVIQLINSASTTPSPLIAGFLYANYGLITGTRIAFGIATIGIFVAALFRMRIKETVEDAEPLNGSELVKSLSGAKVFIEGINVWRYVPRTVFITFIIQALFIVPNSMFNVSFVFYIIDELNIAPVNLAYIFSILSVSIVLLAIPCGKLVDKYGKRRSLLAGWILIAVAAPFLIWGDYIRLIIVMPIIALVNIIFNSAISSLYAELVPIEHRGKISGSRNFFILILGSIGSILGGYIYDNISHFYSLYTIWLATIPLFILTYAFIKEPKKENITVTN